MLSTFCPQTIWTVSLEFCGKPSILAADDFLGACYRKTMTPQKLWTLLFFPTQLAFWSFFSLELRDTLNGGPFRNAPFSEHMLYIERDKNTARRRPRAAKGSGKLGWGGGGDTHVKPLPKNVFGPPPPTIRSPPFPWMGKSCFSNRVLVKTIFEAPKRL